MLYIESLEIDDHILDKIESRHSVTFNEIEEACLSDKRHVRKGSEGLYKFFSQTAGDLSWWYWLTWEVVTVGWQQPGR